MRYSHLFVANFVDSQRATSESEACKDINVGGPGMHAHPGAVLADKARKPNFVLDGHSSRRRITADTQQQPTREFRPVAASRFRNPPWRIGPIRDGPIRVEDHLPAYLVLLRVGFTLPQLLPAARCALTAPFHPYRKLHSRPAAVSSLWHLPSTGLETGIPDVIRHTALRSSDFPLPAEAGSDHPAPSAPLVYRVSTPMA